MNLKTPYQNKREKRLAKIRTYYSALASSPGVMKTAVEREVMKRFGIKARSTVWRIVNK